MHESSFTSIDDLTDRQVMDILQLAEEYERDGSSYAGKGRGLIMGSLFLEPSTRTRGSFESAMLRLGGGVISVTDAATSSIKKGETLADTARIWSGYCDLIVLRHPWEGTAKAVSDFADVPVINAGDGGNEHPTQTLVDLFTLKKEYGKLDGLSMAICGDLRKNRAVHSLIYALLRFGVDSYLIAPRGSELPDHIRSRIRRVHGVDAQSEKVGPFASLFRADPPVGAGAAIPEQQEINLDALYVTNTESHQLTLLSRPGKRSSRSLTGNERFTLYLTRRQQERERPGEDSSAFYLRVTKDVLRRPTFKQAIVMHPLPRVDEIAREVDEDPRSRYFKQARYGVPVRQALVALITGREKWSSPSERVGVRKSALGIGGMACANEMCVSTREPASASRKFTLDQVDGVSELECRYCGKECTAAASCFRRGVHGVVYHPISKITKADIEGERELFVYATVKEAREDGLEPSASYAEPSVESIRK